LGSAQRAACGTCQLLKVGGAKVGYAMAFPVSPNVFSRIELRRIGRKPGQNDSTGLSIDKAAYDSAAMHTQAVPDDQQIPRQLAQNMSEEIDNLRCPDRTRVQSEIEPPPGNRGNNREGLPAEMKLQHGRLTSGRPGPRHVRALTQPAFIDKDYGSALSEGFFLRAGQRYRFHWRIACSSRSKALPAGRWQLQPRSLSRRHTWPGWYRTPHSRSMTSATRGSVQSPVTYPCASAPSRSTRRIRWRCRWSRRGRRPVRPAERRALTPFSSRALAHRETDISLTSRCRATSACFHPLRKSAAAVLLRCSNALSASRSRLTPFGFPMHARYHKHA
jgi:hypothetical protein